MRCCSISSSSRSLSAPTPGASQELPRHTWAAVFRFFTFLPWVSHTERPKLGSLMRNHDPSIAVPHPCANKAYVLLLIIASRDCDSPCHVDLKPVYNKGLEEIVMARSKGLESDARSSVHGIQICFRECWIELPRLSCTSAGEPRDRQPLPNDGKKPSTTI